MNLRGGRQLTKFCLARVKNPGLKTRRRPPGALGGLVLGLALPLVAGGCAGSCTRAPREDPAAARVAASVPRARAAYVSNNGSDSISVLDLDHPGDAAAVALDFDARREAPHHLAIDPTGDRLYVAFAHPRPTAGTDHRAHGRSALAPGEVVSLQLSTLRLLGRFEVDESPGDLVLTARADKVVVTHYDLARAFAGAARGAPPRDLFATLQVWNVRAGTKWAERALCVAPHGIALHGETAYVACYGSDELALVDLRTPDLTTERFPLGAGSGPLGAPRFGPYAATVAPDGRTVAVTELEGKELRFFDLTTRSFGPAVALGARAMMPCFTGDALLVPLAAPDGLARVHDGVLGRRVDLDASCTNPHVTACRHDGRAFVVCEGDHVGSGAVLEVDPVTLATRGRWTVGVYPDALVFGQ